MKFDNEEMHNEGFYRYSELSEKAKKEAFDRFSWDFLKNKRNDKTDEEIIIMLSKHWFDKTGGTYLGTH